MRGRGKGKASPSRCFVPTQQGSRVSAIFFLPFFWGRLLWISWIVTQGGVAFCS